MQRIADKLGVAYLVNGSVRRQGQRVRVTARLTDVAANTDLWSRRYDEQLTDVFAVQDQITEGIVTALGEHFSGNERRRVPIPAYDAYLLARFYINRLRLDLAEERLHEATALDPSYADAYASWAQVYAQQSWNSPPDLEELIARELELVGKALASDPSNPLAQALEALRLSSQPAIETLDALLRRYPSDTDLLFCYSAVLHRVGRFDLEKAVLDRMVALDPLSLNRLLSRGNSLVNWGALADAAQDVRSLEELGLPSPLLSAQIAMLEDDLAAARSQLARPDADWATFPLFWRDLHRAMLAKLQGDAQGVATALAPLEAAGEPLPSYVQFWIAALKGDDELALDQLEEALERGEPYALYDLRVSALRSRLLPELVASARFAGIQRRFGLDDESVAKLSIPPLPF